MTIATASVTEWAVDGSETWSDIAGGPASSQNTDIFVTAGGSRGRKISNAAKGFAVQVNATGEDLSAAVISLRWAVLAGVGQLNTRALGGVSVVVIDTVGNRSNWFVDGGDTYKGGWKVSVVSMAVPESSNTGTPADLTDVEFIGIIWVETAAVGGGDDNCFIDQILSWPIAGIAVTGNSTSLLEDLVDTIDNPANGPYGLFERRSGQLFAKARIDLQPDASDMADSDQTLTFENPVYYAFSSTTIDSCLDEIGLTCSDPDNVTLTRCGVVSADPDEAVTTDANREFDISGAADFDLDTCIIRGFDGTAAVALGGSGQAVDNCTFDACGLLTSSGAVIRDCFFRRATDAAGAIEWDENGDFDRCDFFSDGTGYGIRYRPTGAGPFIENLDNFDFTGYGASETADAAVHIFPVTVDVTITFNITNSGEPTYDEDATYTGDFSSIVDPVDTTVTVLDGRDFSPVEGANVLVKARNNDQLPYQESVTATQTGGTATVAHTAHGMVNGDKVLIEGANEPEYNGVHTIVVTGGLPNLYFFPIDSGADSPATGTITATWVALSGLTNASGVITLNRVMGADQDITGITMKKTTSPVFKDGPITGTISDVEGFAQIVQLILDE